MIKKHIEKVFQNDTDNIIKLIVEETNQKDCLLVTYYNLNQNSEIRLGGTQDSILALFEMIRRQIYELKTGKKYIPKQK